MLCMAEQTGMGTDMGVTIISDRIDEILGGIERRMMDTSAFMPTIGLYMTSQVQKRIKDGIPPANSTITQEYKSNDHTLRDTGVYMASFNYRVLNNHTVRIGTAQKQARILQNGGTISAKKAKALYIPAGAMTRKFERAAGVKDSASSSVRGVINYLETSGYTVWWTKGAVMAKKGKKGADIPVYYLKKSVTIPARKHLYVSDENRADIRRMVAAYITKGQTK